MVPPKYTPRNEKRITSVQKKALNEFPKKETIRKRYTWDFQSEMRGKKRWNVLNPFFLAKAYRKMDALEREAAFNSSIKNACRSFGIFNIKKRKKISELVAKYRELKVAVRDGEEAMKMLVQKPAVSKAMLHPILYFSKEKKSRKIELTQRNLIKLSEQRNEVSAELNKLLGGNIAVEFVNRFEDSYFSLLFPKLRRNK